MENQKIWFNHTDLGLIFTANILTYVIITLLLEHGNKNPQSQNNVLRYVLKVYKLSHRTVNI